MKNYTYIKNELLSLKITYEKFQNDYYILEIEIFSPAYRVDMVDMEDFSSKGADLLKYEEDIKNQFAEYFAGDRKNFDLKIKLTGSEFQIKVWHALMDIPYGETRSYKDIAAQIGNEKASRAVGMANNKNKIPIIVPCHRVIGSNGSLVGYAGGLEVKKILLDIESKNK